MKALIPENTTRKLYFYSLIYLSLSLPFQFISFPPTLGIIAIVTVWVFSSRSRVKLNRLKGNKPLIAILLLFFMAPLCVIYSSNTAEGWNDTLVKLPLLLFPLILGTIPALGVKKTRLLLLTFALTTASGALVLLLKALYLYTLDGQLHHFFYHNLVNFKRVPIHYFAMFCNFSFFILAYYCTKSYRNLKPFFSYAYVFALLLLMSVLFLTAVRIQLVAFVIAMAVYVAWYYRNRRNWKRMIIVFISLFAIFSTLILSLPGSRKRIEDAYVEWQVFTGENTSKQTNHRVYLWTDGTEVIKEHFWSGTGTGAANDALYEKIKLRDEPFFDGQNYYTLARKKYNFHNAFLQHFATFGVIGFVILVVVFVLPLRYFLIRDFQLLPLLFLLISLISFLTESMLERQAGNMFFGFFYGLLVCNSRYFQIPIDK